MRLAPDKYGYKLVLQLPSVLGCCVAATAAFATHAVAFYLPFVLFGAAAGGTVLSGMNVITEMCRSTQRYGRVTQRCWRFRI